MRAIHLGSVLLISVIGALPAAAASAGEDPTPASSTLSSMPVEVLDEELEGMLTSIIASAAIDPEGSIFLSDAPGEPRFLERDSGFYWQINGNGQDAFLSRSLWDRELTPSDRKAWEMPHYYDSSQFPGEPLRVAERTVRLQGSDVVWQFVVARSRVQGD